MLLLTNISQLVTVAGNNDGPRRGKTLSDIGLIRDGFVFCNGGQIMMVGRQRDILKYPWSRKGKKVIVELDCTGKTVLPGFVDSHTHPVFTAPRLVDFEKRIRGASYAQIAAAGGGIRSSVAGVRAASRKVLADTALASFNAMLACGTTTVEAKSGYGLSLESELKSLEAVRDAGNYWAGTVVPTLLGAHVVPGEFKRRSAAYLREVCERMIPSAARRRLATFVDVFCEEGAFSLAAAEEVFAAARHHGLVPRAHVGQFSPCFLAPLLEHKPASLDHMDYFHGRDLAALKRSRTVCTLLPGSNHFLGHKRYPNARRLIAAGVAVALATDYNPGTSPTLSMPFILSLACTQMKLSPAEAITAATINGAHALQLAGRKGSVEHGKDADLAIFPVKDYREITYWLGTNLCEATIAGGEVHRVPWAFDRL